MIWFPVLIDCLDIHKPQENLAESWLSLPLSSGENPWDDSHSAKGWHFGKCLKVVVTSDIQTLFHPVTLLCCSGDSGQWASLGLPSAQQTNWFLDRSSFLSFFRGTNIPSRILLRLFWLRFKSVIGISPKSPGGRTLHKNSFLCRLKYLSRRKPTKKSCWLPLTSEGYCPNTACSVCLYLGIDLVIILLFCSHSR